MTTFDKSITTDPNKVKDLEYYILEINTELSGYLYEVYQQLLKECILADNIPGIDLMMRYCGSDHVDHVELFKIAANQRIETIIHLFVYYCDDCNNDALCYADFVKLTEHNTDSRVKRFVTNLEPFITLTGYVPIYDKSLDERIRNQDFTTEEIQKLIRFENLMENACNFISKGKSSRKSYIESD